MPIEGAKGAKNETLETFSKQGHCWRNLQLLGCKLKQIHCVRA